MVSLIFDIIVGWALYRILLNFFAPISKAVELYNVNNSPKPAAPIKTSDVPAPVVLYRQDPFKSRK